MANIATFMCSLMLAQVERDNKRAAKRQERLLEREISSTSGDNPNTLNDKLFARLVQKDSSLKELRITDDYFAKDSTRAGLGKARDKLESIVKGDSSKWQKVRKVLLRHCVLNKLEIHYVSLERDDKFLSQILHKMPQLTQLVLVGNELANTGTSMLSKSLVTSKTTLLQSLVLDSNQIGNDGAAHLATSLSSSHTTLLNLSLKQNYIKSAGACALARMLNHQHNTVLQRLDLSQNFIHSTGAIALATSLQHNSSLRELDLSYNDNQVTLQCIGDAGSKAFGACLKKNSSLEILRLCGNHVGPTGCQALAAGLATNNTLKELHLDNNSIGIVGFLALCKALETNKTLQVLSLQDTMVPIEASVQQALMEMLKVNTTLLELHSSVVPDEGRFLLELNRGLRPLLLERENNVPTALWPYVLERCNKESTPYMRLNLAYYCIQEKSDVFRR